MNHEALVYSRVKPGTDCPSYFPELLAVEEKAKPFPHLAFAYCCLSSGQMLSGCYDSRCAAAHGLVAVSSQCGQCSP